MKMRIIVLVVLIGLVSWQPITGQNWLTEKGTIAFSSEAPLEIIKAKSNQLRGILNTVSNSFAFTVDVISFEGFNSELQLEHFLENYMESKKFPRATFVGKLIEVIPYNTPGTYDIRAKGMLTIHGIAKERIIRGSFTVNSSGAELRTNFSLPLSDHGIAIPRIVQQKIAEQIQVQVDVTFRKS